MNLRSPMRPAPYGYATLEGMTKARAGDLFWFECDSWEPCVPGASYQDLVRPLAPAEKRKDELVRLAASFMRRRYGTTREAKAAGEDPAWYAKFGLLVDFVDELAAEPS